MSRATAWCCQRSTRYGVGPYLGAVYAGPRDWCARRGGFRGARYLLVAPDYIGLGASSIRHPYLYATTEANAVIDLPRAARRAVAASGLARPKALLFTGFSQGEHATLATQRALEAVPVDGLVVRLVPPRQSRDRSILPASLFQMRSKGDPLPRACTLRT